MATTICVCVDCLDEKTYYDFCRDCERCDDHCICWVEEYNGLGRYTGDGAVNGYNYPLMVDVLATIEAFPEKWRQDNWSVVIDGQKVKEGFSCGTAYCFAGWAAHLSGNPTWTLREDVAPDAWTGMSESRTLHGGSIEFEAENLLGLYPGQRDALFLASNPKERLYELIARYVGVTEDDLRAEVNNRIPELVEQKRLEDEAILRELHAAVGEAYLAQRVVDADDPVAVAKASVALQKAIHRLQVFQA